MDNNFNDDQVNILLKKIENINLTPDIEEKLVIHKQKENSFSVDEHQKLNRLVAS